MTYITFPNFTLVSASAGSGKTTELTERFLRLLLSDNVPNNSLHNILAVTFTNNAALEMKQRVLETLKKASFGDEETLKKLGGEIGLKRDVLVQRAQEKVNYILDNYSDFQVQTIDSFLSRIMKVSAIEFGLPPSFDVILDSNIILDEAFEQLAQELGYNDKKRDLFKQLIEIINRNLKSGQSFLWNPYKKLISEVKDIYKKLSSHAGQIVNKDQQQRIGELRNKIFEIISTIDETVKKSGFEMVKNYEAIVDSARCRDFDGVISKKLAQKVLKVSKDKNFSAVVSEIENLQQRLMENVGEYYLASSLQYYQPFVVVNQYLLEFIEKVRRQRSTVALSETTKMLASNIYEMNIPEIYFSLGEQIFHFLIDEFQDTSPIQWAALRPLIEESLGKAGSLFLVGDTKQAIYSFRGGDWQIMAKMRKNEEFASVQCNRKELDTNYRSSEAIVKFAEKIFHEIVPKHIEPSVADRSGLISYEQKVYTKYKGKGYVEVKCFDKSEDETDNLPERQAIIEIIRDCLSRGYQLGDIAILTPKNQYVISVSGWLNAEGYKFLSHSSLDIRKQKLTGEILSLLKFLDSPIDNLSFASFLLSDIFSAEFKSTNLLFDIHKLLFEWRRNKRENKALYSYFREQYPQQWEIYFEHLFNVVGYLPLYDLIAEVYKRFNLFENFPDEAATLVKLLEAINSYEGQGGLSLKDFLSFTEEESEEETWSIPVSPSENAITIMTIHKAKGLGFPIVIALFYDSKPQYDSKIVVEDENGIRLMHIVKNESEYHPELLKIYNEKENLRKVDELNKLYVALTRARKEMYVLLVKGKQKETTKFFPEDSFTIGNRTIAEREPTEEEKEASIIYPKTQGTRQSSEFTKIGLEETKRGDFIHGVLAQILYIQDSIETQIQQAINNIKYKHDEELDFGRITSLIHKFISNKDVIEYFSERPDRKVLTEQEIVSQSGALYRIDRIVIDSDSVTVIDFKTGSESEEHKKQVKEYVEILESKFPSKTIRGVLAYVDLGLLRDVK